jgi:hypothetical protein
VPAGLTFDGFVSVTGGDYKITGNQISWTNLPAFSPSATTQTLDYRARVNPYTVGQTFQNTAQLTATQQADPESGNNSSTASVFVNKMVIYWAFFAN